MFSILIGNQKLTGRISLDAAGSLDGIVDAGSLMLTSTRQLSYEGWYSEFVDNKRSSMLFGGSLSAYSDLSEPPDGYSGEYLYDFSGLENIEGNPFKRGKYLSAFQHTAPHYNGDISLLSSRTVDVSKGDNSDSASDSASDSVSVIKISLPSDHFRTNSYLQELYLLMWRMYQAVNSFAGRLQIFAPTIPRDGKPGLTTFGYYLGTYLNYQALVSRWNFNAWKESFTFDVVEAGEILSVAIGYTCLNCHEAGVQYSLEVRYCGTGKDFDDSSSFDCSCSDFSESASFIDPPDESESHSWAHYLTIFDQGVDTDTNSKQLVASTKFYRNAAETGGSGYEGRYPGNMSSASVSTTITPSAGNTYAFSAEQYYRNIIAIGPCTGIQSEYIVQKGASTVFHRLLLTATWTVGGETFNQTKVALIAATAVYT